MITAYLVVLSQSTIVDMLLARLCRKATEERKTDFVEAQYNLSISISVIHTVMCCEINF